MKLFFIMMTFVQLAQAWELVSQETNRPQETHCPERIEVKEEFNHSAIEIAAINDSTNAGWSITNVNQGPNCIKNNSTSILNSSECVESKYGHRTYSFSWCENKLTDLKCSPFAKKEVVTTIALRGSRIIITDDNSLWYNGALLLKCTYEQ